MTEEEKRLTLRWIETWRRAGPELERIRREEIRAADTQRAVKIFSGLVAEHLRRRPLRMHSGLVTQQAVLHRKRP